MQVRQRLGGLREVAEHARRREPGAPAVGQQRRQVGAVDPVHRDDVVVAVEEVLAHERQRRVRREGEQHARLAEQLLARRRVAHRADLQRDEAAVLAVERLDDLRLAAGAERLEHLVAVLEQGQHGRACRRLGRVSPQIEVISGVRSWRLELAADRSTIGKAAENDVALPDDPTASHLHAVLERFPAGWCVTDLGSSNGTWVNGERIWASRRLRHGDEIRVGQTRLMFRDPLTAAGAATEAEQGRRR